jgi:hypothetical protein
MLHVTLVNLSPDGRTAQPELGRTPLGHLAPEALVRLLDSFRTIDPVQNHDAEPQIVIESAQGKFLIRTGRGKLFLYDARDSSVPFVELDPAGIVQELSRARDLVHGEPEEQPVTPRRRRFQHLIAAAMLLGGVILNSYTVYSVFYVETVDPKPPVQLVTDARELTALKGSARGRYATGRDPGDRILEVTSDGRVRFLRVITGGERLDGEDTYRIGRTSGRVCLVTVDSGVIEVGNIDTLTYYRDSYRRQ